MIVSWSLQALHKRVFQGLDCDGARGVVWEQVVVVDQLGQSSCVSRAARSLATPASVILLFFSRHIK